MFMGSSSKPESAQKPSVQEQQTQQQTQATQESAPVSAYTQPTPETSSSPGQPVVSLNESTPSESQNPNSAAPGKQKKVLPTPSKTPEKKKVTVDDLINDN